MSRLFDDASSQHLQYAGAVVTAPPFTLAGWVRPDATTGVTATIVGLGNSGASDYVQLAWQGADGKIRARTSDGSSVTAFSTTADLSTGTWKHACGVFASATDRRAFLNGGGKGTNSTSRTAAGLNRTAIGRNPNSDLNFYASGDLAECAVWSVALADDEVASLAKGVSPLLVRPDALIAYWPVLGRFSPEPDLIGTFNLTVTGATQSEHPRIYYPQNPRLYVPAGASPRTITATRLASSSALYAGATVTASATISHTRLASAATVRTGATLAATNDITATRLASAAQVRGGATVSAAATISATRIASAASVRAGATVSPGPTTITASRLASSAEVRSGATVSAVATITASCLASSAQVRPGGTVSATATVTATRLASSGAVRTGATVSQGGASQTVTALRIASASAVRTGATVTPGAATVTASRLSSTAQVRSGATIVASAQVTATRLESAAQVRAGAILTPGAVTVTATRIEAASAIRTGAILTPGAVAITAARLAATSSVRGGVVLSASTTIGATRISAASLVRSGHTLTPGEVAIQAARLAAASAVRSGARIGLVYQPVPSRAPLAAQGREEIAGNVRAGASGRSRMGELTPAKRNHFTGRDRP